MKVSVADVRTIDLIGIETTMEDGRQRSVSRIMTVTFINDEFESISIDSGTVRMVVPFNKVEEMIIEMRRERDENR